MVFEGVAAWRIKVRVEPCVCACVRESCFRKSTYAGGELEITILVGWCPLLSSGESGLPFVIAQGKYEPRGRKPSETRVICAKVALNFRGERCTSTRLKNMFLRDETDSRRVKVGGRRS